MGGNTDTPTKSSKLSIFGSKDKKDKTDKNASDKDNNSKMPLGLGGKPKGASSDGFDAGDSFKSLEDDAAPREGVGGGSETKDGVGGTHLKDNENGTVEKDSSTANVETPTKSSKLSI